MMVKSRLLPFCRFTCHNFRPRVFHYFESCILLDLQFCVIRLKGRLFEFQSIDKLQPTTTDDLVHNNSLELRSSDRMVQACSGEVVSGTSDLRIKADANDKQLLQSFGVGVPVKNEVILPPVLMYSLW